MDIEITSESTNGDSWESQKVSEVIRLAMATSDSCRAGYVLIFARTRITVRSSLHSRALGRRRAYLARHIPLASSIL